jgi:4-methylaminobutanoate oxidase (formaldehyde-forming)
MTTSPDVLVVGCGALGLSVAHNLARMGARVVALDREEPGSQTSARAAGQSVIAQTEPAVGALMHRSIAMIVNFADENGVPFPFNQVGSIKYACSDWAADQLEREVVRATALGARVRMVSLTDAAELAPHTDPTSAVAAWHAPDDVYFRPQDMLAAFRAAAANAGVEFRIGADVQAITGDGRGVAGVKTRDEHIAAGSMVLAAGAWSGSLLERIGVGSLPLVYVRHQYSIRSGITGIHAGLPSVRVVDHAVYARPEGENLMFGTYEPHPQVVEADAIPARTAELALDVGPIDAALHQVASIFPGISEAAVVEMRGGVVSMTPDGLYLVDEAPEMPGLFFLTGCNVRGLSVSPAMGEDVARWVTSGNCPASLAPFGLARFQGVDTTSAEVRRRGLALYESIYRDQESAHEVRQYGNSHPAFGA